MNYNVKLIDGKFCIGNDTSDDKLNKDFSNYDNKISLSSNDKIAINDSDDANAPKYI